MASDREEEVFFDNFRHILLERKTQDELRTIFLSGDDKERTKNIRLSFAFGDKIVDELAKADTPAKRKECRMIFYRSQIFCLHGVIRDIIAFGKPNEAGLKPCKPILKMLDGVTDNLKRLSSHLVKECLPVDVKVIDIDIDLDEHPKHLSPLETFTVASAIFDEPSLLEEKVASLFDSKEHVFQIIRMISRKVRPTIVVMCNTDDPDDLGRVVKYITATLEIVSRANSFLEDEFEKIMWTTFDEGKIDTEELRHLDVYQNQGWVTEFNLVISFKNLVEKIEQLSSNVSGDILALLLNQLVDKTAINK